MKLTTLSSMNQNCQGLANKIVSSIVSRFKYLQEEDKKKNSTREPTYILLASIAQACNLHAEAIESESQSWETDSWMLVLLQRYSRSPLPHDMAQLVLTNNFRGMVNTLLKVLSNKPLPLEKFLRGVPSTEQQLGLRKRNYTQLGSEIVVKAKPKYKYIKTPITVNHPWIHGPIQDGEIAESIERLRKLDYTAAQATTVVFFKMNWDITHLPMDSPKVFYCRNQIRRNENGVMFCMFTTDLEPIGPYLSSIAKTLVWTCFPHQKQGAKFVLSDWEIQLHQQEVKRRKEQLKTLSQSGP
ncbi:MAG: hypothetical protein ACRCZI_05900 [Cetobacterium sp.]